MIIAARYSFNGGELYIDKYFPELLEEVEKTIKNVDASKCRKKSVKKKPYMDKFCIALGN